MDWRADVRSARWRIVDNYTRECLALDVDTSFPSPRVTRVLDKLAATRGWPERIRVDNGLKASAFASFFAE